MERQTSRQRQTDRQTDRGMDRQTMDRLWTTRHRQAMVILQDPLQERDPTNKVDVHCHSRSEIAVVPMVREFTFVFVFFAYVFVCIVVCVCMCMCVCVCVCVLAHQLLNIWQLWTQNFSQRFIKQKEETDKTAKKNQQLHSTTCTENLIHKSELHCRFIGRNSFMSLF